MNNDSEIESLAPWLVIFITLLGGWLRIFMLDSKGMWLDETFSVWLANQSVADMLQWIIKIDQHPPLYYLLLHYWVALNGDTAYYARLLSVIFGTATIPIIYLIGKRMSNGMMGLAAAMILTLSPFHIRFAQETRMYTLLTFNASVAIYALVRLLTDSRSVNPIGSQFREYIRAWREEALPAEPKVEEDFSYKQKSRSQTEKKAWIFRRRWLPIQAIETYLAWIVFIVFSALTLLSHNTAVLFILAINVFVLGLMLYQRKNKSDAQPAFQSPSFGNWIKAQIGIFLLWSPWLFAFIQQTSRVYQEFWIPAPTWGMVMQVLRSFLNESILNEYVLHQADQITVMWVLYVLALCFGLVHYRKQISRFFFLVVLFAVPFLGELIVSIRRPIFYDRTLIWITIPLFLLLAAGIAQLRYRLLILVVVGIFATNNLSSAVENFRYMQKEDWGTAAGYVANFAEKDDLILFNATWVQIPFDYYFKTYEELYSLQVVKHGVPVDMFDRGILEPKMTDSDIPGLFSLVNGRKRVWLVYSHNSYTDPKGIIPKALASKMKVTRTRDFFGGKVQLYEAP